MFLHFATSSCSLGSLFNMPPAPLQLLRQLVVDTSHLPGRQDPSGWVHPMLQAVSMGWSWTMWLSQRVPQFQFQLGPNIGMDRTACHMRITSTLQELTRGGFKQRRMGPWLKTERVDLLCMRSLMQPQQHNVWVFWLISLWLLAEQARKGKEGSCFPWGQMDLSRFKGKLWEDSWVRSQSVQQQKQFQGHHTNIHVSSGNWKQHGNCRVVFTMA